jgi:hypothetical protein
VSWQRKFLAIYTDYYRCHGGMFHLGHTSARVMAHLRTRFTQLQAELFDGVDAALQVRVAEYLVPDANLAAMALRAREEGVCAFIVRLPACVVPRGNADWHQRFGVALEETGGGMVRAMLSATLEGGDLEAYVSFEQGKGPTDAGAAHTAVLEALLGVMRTVTLERPADVRVYQLRDNRALNVPFMGRVLALQRLATARAIGGVVTVRKPGDKGQAPQQVRGLDLAMHDRGSLAFDALVRCLSLGATSFVRALTPLQAGRGSWPDLKAQYEAFVGARVMLPAAREYRCLHLAVRYSANASMPPFLRDALVTTGTTKSGVWLHAVDDEVNGVCYVMLVPHAHVHMGTLEAVARAHLRTASGRASVELVHLTPFDPTSRLDPVTALFGTTVHSRVPRPDELDEYVQLVVRAVASPCVPKPLEKSFLLFTGNPCKAVTTVRRNLIQSKRHLVLGSVDLNRLAFAPREVLRVGSMFITRFFTACQEHRDISLWWNESPLVANGARTPLVIPPPPPPPEVVVTAVATPLPEWMQGNPFPVPLGVSQALCPSPVSPAPRFEAVKPSRVRTRAELDKALDDASHVIADAVGMIQPVLATMGRARERGFRMDLGAVRTLTATISQAGEQYERARLEMEQLPPDSPPPSKRARLDADSPPPSKRARLDAEVEAADALREMRGAE